MVKILDIMHRGVITCLPGDSLRTVVKLMEEYKVRSIIVVHESGEVWGLISYLDVLPHYGKDSDRITAEEVMKPYKIDVDPNWSIEKGVELMIKHRIQHLIIVDPHAGLIRPIAILTSCDIVRYMSNVETGNFKQMLTLNSGLQKK